MASKAQQYVDGFVARGFTPVQAAVLAGNFATESGFNPEAYNPKEDAYGGMQWRLDRKTGLENYAKETGRKVSDPEAQMDWVVKEMTGNEAANAAAFLAAQDPFTANSALKGFIRYAPGTENKRLSNALSYMGQPSSGGNALMGGTQVADNGNNPLFVNPSFGGGAMPGVPQWPSPASQPVAQPAAPEEFGAPTGAGTYRQAEPQADESLLNQFAAPAGKGQSDDDLLNSFLPGGSGIEVPSANAADDDLLKSFMPAEAPPDTAAKPDDQSVERNDLNRMLFGGDRAPSNIMELITGTGEKKNELGGYAGDVGKRLEANPENGYEPSSVPWLDPVSTFANAAVDAVPIVGPALTGLGNQFDAGVASMIEGKPVTPEERAAINAGQAKQFGELNTAGQITGTVGPFLGLGATGLGGRLLGVTGSLPARVLMGGASNALITGADTAARGGDMDAIRNNALMGGLAGGAVPAAFGLAGKAGNALLGKTSPEVAALAETAINKYGIPIGPGQITESPMIKMADSVVNKMPFSGGTVSNGQQAAAFNKAVANTFGESAEKITPDVMARARDRIGDVFDNVAAKTPAIAADPAFDQAMLDAVSNAQMNLTEQQMGPIVKQFDNIVGKFQDGGNAITGKVYQELTKKGAPLDVALHSADPGIRAFARQAREALDDAFERSASPDVLADLKGARAQWKAMKTVEDLVEKAPAGDISPALLMNAVRNSYEGMAYGGGGDLAELAKIGQQFLKAPPSSGTAERLAVMNALTKVGGAGGLAATAVMNPGSLPMMAAIGVPTAAAYLAAAKGGGALLRSPALANKLIGNSLGQTANPATLKGLNLLLRGATGTGTLENMRKPVEITVQGGNPLLAQ